MLARKAVENVGESADDHQKVDESLNLAVEEPSRDLSVEENIEPQAQNDDEDTREVVEIMVFNSFGSKYQQKEVDEEIQP